MSQQNVELVQDQFLATNERDFARVTSHWADDIELTLPAEAFLGGGRHSGKDAVGQWFGEWYRSFERGYRFNVEEVRDVGDAILVVAEHDGRGRASGAAVRARMAYLYRVRDGRIARIEVYPHRADALEAAGLPDTDAPAD